MTGTVRHRGRTWSFQVDNGRHPDGRRRWRTQGGFRTKRDAQRALNEVLRQLDDGSYVQPSKATVAEFLMGEWLPGMRAVVRPGTLANYQRDARRYLIPALGGTRLRDLTTGRVNALIAELLDRGGAHHQGLAPKTVRNIVGSLHKALADAVAWGLLARNPADAAALPRAPRADMRVWTGAQLAAFLASVRHDRLHAGWVLLATTGMRRGELLGLRWTDVDLDAGRLAVRQALLTIDYTVTVSEPKTRRGHRSVALDAGTVAALRAHRHQQRHERLAWGPSWADTGLVFTRPDGTLIHPQRLSKWFEQRARAARLPPIRLHDLRHSWATAALAAGIHPKVVSERLGHATVSITLDTYSHVLPGMDAHAAELVAASILT